METYKENGINWECRYGLRAIESCRKCLFEALCHLEKNDSLVNKRKKSDLYSNNNKEWV
jgi:hypothetical protein